MMPAWSPTGSAGWRGSTADPGRARRAGWIER